MPSIILRESDSNNSATYEDDTLILNIKAVDMQEVYKILQKLKINLTLTDYTEKEIKVSFAESYFATTLILSIIKEKNLADFQQIACSFLSIFTIPFCHEYTSLQHFKSDIDSYTYEYFLLFYYLKVYYANKEYCDQSIEVIKNLKNILPSLAVRCSQFAFENCYKEFFYSLTKLYSDAPDTACEKLRKINEIFIFLNSKNEILGNLKIHYTEYFPHVIIEKLDVYYESYLILQEKLKDYNGNEKLLSIFLDHVEFFQLQLNDELFKKFITISNHNFVESLRQTILATIRENLNLIPGDQKSFFYDSVIKHTNSELSYSQKKRAY